MRPVPAMAAWSCSDWHSGHRQSCTLSRQPGSRFASGALSGVCTYPCKCIASSHMSTCLNVYRLMRIGCLCGRPISCRKPAVQSFRRPGACQGIQISSPICLFDCTCCLSTLRVFQAHNEANETSVIYEGIQVQVCSLGRELLGGNGVVADYLVAKSFCDLVRARFCTRNCTSDG